MIEEFSGGYYRAKMDVQPYSDGPVIECGLYNHIQNRLYNRTDAPITMRIGLDKGPLFSVDCEGAVPTNVLAVPQKWLDDMSVSNTGKKGVFLLKPEHSYQLNRIHGVGDEWK